MPDDTIQPADAAAIAPAGAHLHLLFLSHAGVDSEAALRLARRLEESEEAKAHGLKVWIDKTDLGAGGRWKDALQSALASSTAFAVYVGSHGVVNWVWDEVSVALDRAHKEREYPLVPVLAPGTSSADLPSFLSQYQSVGDPEQPDEFKKLLRAMLRLEPRAKLAIEREPFVGLQAYTSHKAHLFFGREKQTDELVSLFGNAPLVLVTGDSGSGKSSLVLAGLVPAFRGGRLGGSRDAGPDETIWHVLETRPGNDPFGRLADSVRDAAERTGTELIKASELADLVRTRQPDKVRDAVLSGAPKGPGRPSKVLVVVDQFEEFRTSPQAPAYVAALLRLATPDDDRIRVVLTMRRDYLYACDSFPDLSKRLQGKPSPRYLLHRMSPNGLREVITRPLDLAGIDERDREDLARAVLKDVGDEPGELALLQMALWRTWSEAHGQGPDLVKAYGRIGRVEGALAQAADEVFNRLSPDEQRRAETLFVRLVRPGEAGGATRRVARLEEFDTPTRALADKLSQVEQSRLLTIREDTVEIAHEQLATQWLRYQRWIANLSGDPEQGIPANPRGDDLRLLQSLIADAARWEAALADEPAPADVVGVYESDCSIGVVRYQDLPAARYHATGVYLDLYQQLAGRRDTWLSDVERRFVAASVDADEQHKKRQQEERDERERLAFERGREQLSAARRYRRIATVAALVAVLALTSAGVAGWFWHKSVRAQQLTAMQLLAIQARRVATEANTPDAIERAAALALESIGIARKGNRPSEVDAIETSRLTLTRLPLLALPHGSPVKSLAVLGDGRLASGGDDGRIKLWPKDGWGEPAVLTHGSPVLSLAVLEDGRLASGGDDGRIKLWPKDNADAPVVLTQGGEILSLVVLRDGRLASGGGDGIIKLWPNNGAGDSVVLTHGKGLVRSLAVLEDGRLASGGDDGIIKLWPNNGEGEPVVLARGSSVLSLAVLPDGRLASGGRDGTRLWWPKDGGGNPVVLTTGSHVVVSLAVLGDGRLASGGKDGRIKLWGDGEPVVLTHSSLAVQSLVTLADGRLASGGDDGTIKLWPRDGEGEPVVLTHAVATSVTGSAVPALAVLQDGRLASGGQDGKIRLWPKDGEGEPVVLTYGPGLGTGGVLCLAVLRDGRLASSGWWMRFWPKDGVGEPSVVTRGGEVLSLVVMRDGRLATSDAYGGIEVWSSSGDADWPVRLTHGSPAKSLAVLGDGRLASGGEDGKIKLSWIEHRRAETMVLTHGSPVRSLAVLPDGRLASGGQDGRIKLWSTKDREPVTLTHGTSVRTLAVLEDGRLASGGEDGRIKLWPKDGGGEPAVLTHGSPVLSLAVLEDGRLASGGDDGRIKLWLVDEEKLIAALCLRAGRNLSKDEWARYIGLDTPWQPSCRDLPSNWRTPDP
jgi:WD40 repeat protein